MDFCCSTFQLSCVAFPVQLNILCSLSSKSFYISCIASLFYPYQIPVRKQLFPYIRNCILSVNLLCPRILLRSGSCSAHRVLCHCFSAFKFVSCKSHYFQPFRCLFSVFAFFLLLSPLIRWPDYIQRITKALRMRL